MYILLSSLLFNYFIFMGKTLLLLLFIKFTFLINIKRIGDWGLGIGDWGLGIGDWAQSPIPNPQSPIPNPHKK